MRDNFFSNEDSCVLMYTIHVRDFMKKMYDNINWKLQKGIKFSKKVGRLTGLSKRLYKRKFSTVERKLPVNLTGKRNHLDLVNMI